MNLQNAYMYCEEVTRSNSSNFYHAFSLLPTAKRRAVYAVYAFCRQLDDLVDEQERTPEQRGRDVELFYVKMRGAQNGFWPQDDPMWMALQDVFAEYNLLWEPFFGMLEGQVSDLTFSAPRTMAELERYGYLVAGTVGEMILPILAPAYTPEMREEAVYLGVAMQITNILRDVREDLQRGRVYLPTALLEECGVTEEMLRHGVCDANWQDLAARLAARAEELYARGMASFASYPLHAQLPLLLAGEMYREILREIGRRKYDVFAERVFVSSSRQQALLKQLTKRLAKNAVSVLVR